MHKRIQARIHRTAYTSTNSQAPEHGRTMQDHARQSPEKVRIQGDPLRAIYGIYPPPYYQKT